MREKLERMLPELAEAEAQLNTATVKLAELEKRPDAAEERHDRWEELVIAHRRWSALENERDRLRMEVEAAENEHKKTAIRLEKYKNDYEAQFDPFAVRNRIARCGVAVCSAADFLNDERFEVFQPHVLEMVGAHHAYTRGLTGRGVRIGIDDDIVNYRLPEFAGRISFDGARLTYPVLFGDEPESNARRCDLASTSERAELNCRITSYDLGMAGNLVETLAARWHIANYGWPGHRQEVFLRNDAVEERWTPIVGQFGGALLVVAGAVHACRGVDPAAARARDRRRGGWRWPAPSRVYAGYRRHPGKTGRGQVTERCRRLARWEWREGGRPSVAQGRGSDGR